LLCAGITTYSPLKHWRVGEGTKVAIVGMGGLGNVAVKIAAAMGAEVTMLSQTLSKQEDGLRFGAKHYYATSERDTFKQLENSFDLILNTVSANLDLDRYLSLPSCRRHARQRRRAVTARQLPRLLADRRTAQHCRIADRRTAGDAGDAQFLRRARRPSRDRVDRGRRGRIGL
jgi:shikimate 5-dehydrogenase